jgi:RimJ/RimL family protein N-acetyltransferase
VNLRPATREDAARLLAWRNDASTRRWSFSSDPVPADDHHAWLERKLADPDTAIFVAEDEGGPVGQLRIDRRDAHGVVSIAVAPEARGRGVGTRMLEEAARARPLGVAVLRAEVVPANETSLRMFLKAGFEEVARTARAVTLERAVGARGRG